MFLNERLKNNQIVWLSFKSIRKRLLKLALPSEVTYIRGLRARTRSDSKSRTFPSRESSRHSPWSRALCGTLSLWHSPAGSMSSATVCKCFGSTVKFSAGKREMRKTYGQRVTYPSLLYRWEVFWDREFLVFVTTRHVYQKNLGFNPLWTRQPYLAPNYKVHYFINCTKLINYVFCKMLIRSSSFQENTKEGEGLKATHFIGVLVGCLKNKLR